MKLATYQSKYSLLLYLFPSLLGVGDVLMNFCSPLLSSKASCSIPSLNPLPPSFHRSLGLPHFVFPYTSEIICWFLVVFSQFKPLCKNSQSRSFKILYEIGPRIWSRNWTWSILISGHIRWLRMQACVCNQTQKMWRIMKIKCTCIVSSQVGGASNIFQLKKKSWLYI